MLMTKKELYFNDVKIPEPKSDEVLIRIKYTGICGSDLHYYREGCIGDNIIKAPHILGHESSGEVTEIGKNVTGLKIGDNIVIEPGIPCLSCELCRKGQYNLCDQVSFFGAPPFNGTFREYVTHKSLFTHKLPDGVDLKTGALVKPLAVGFNALSRMKFKPGQKVLITGSGPIGIMIMIISIAAGARVTYY